MVAAKTATEAALYWLFGARDSKGPRDLHAVRPKLVAGLTANTAWTCSGLKCRSIPHEPVVMTGVLQVTQRNGHPKAGLSTWLHGHVERGGEGARMGVTHMVGACHIHGGDVKVEMRTIRGSLLCLGDCFAAEYVASGVNSSIA